MINEKTKIEIYSILALRLVQFYRQMESEIKTPEELFESIPVHIGSTFLVLTSFDEEDFNKHLEKVSLLGALGGKDLFTRLQIGKEYFLLELELDRNKYNLLKEDSTPDKLRESFPFTTVRTQTSILLYDAILDILFERSKMKYSESETLSELKNAADLELICHLSIEINNFKDYAKRKTPEIIPLLQRQKLYKQLKVFETVYLEISQDKRNQLLEQIRKEQVLMSKLNLNQRE